MNGEAGRVQSTLSCVAVHPHRLLQQPTPKAPSPFCVRAPLLKHELISVTRGEDVARE